MNNILILILVICIGYKGWGLYQINSVKSFFNQPYLVVYGRDTCSLTRNTVDVLKNNGIRFQYKSVDDSTIASELHGKMRRQGIDTSYYLLPVVDFNNSISVRPENHELISRATSLSLCSFNSRWRGVFYYIQNCY